MITVIVASGFLVVIATLIAWFRINHWAGQTAFWRQEAENIRNQALHINGEKAALAKEMEYLKGTFNAIAQRPVTAALNDQQYSQLVQVMHTNLELVREELTRAAKTEGGKKPN